MSLRRTHFTFSIVALAAVVGCGSAHDATASRGGAAPATAGAAAQPVAATPDRGFIANLRGGLGAAGLSAEQRGRADAILAELERGAHPVRESARALALSVADGVQAGRLDDAAVASGTEKLVAGVDAMKPLAKKALSDLHALLTPEQRRALVDQMRREGESRRAAMRGDGEGGVRERMKRLAEDLRLSPTQIEQVRATVRARVAANAGAGPELRARREAMVDHLRRVGEAFVAEPFDPEKLEIGRDAPDVARWTVKVRVGLVDALLPALDADQRARFATLIRERAERMEDVDGE